MSDRAYAKNQTPQKTSMNPSPSSNLLQHIRAYAQAAIAIDGYSTYRNEQSPLGRAHKPRESSCVAVQDDASAHETNISLNTTSHRASHLGHHFSQIPLYPAQRAVLQTKLTANQPGDMYEQEADHVAEQVMRMEAPGSSIAPVIPDDESKDKLLMRTEASGIAAAETTNVPPIVHEVLNDGNGQALDGATRAFMEPRFGHDFSRVRVHTDERAAESARSVNALAYTVGRDVVFGCGQYATTTSEGRRLLAHELTHVVQQSSHIIHASASGPQLQRKEKKTPDRSADAAEERAKSNRKKVGQTLPLLQKYAGDIPLYLLLGWIDIESSGDVTHEEKNALDEISYFQISAEERKAIKFDKPGDREKMLQDTKVGREFAIKAGIADVKLHEKFIQTLGVTRNPASETYWKLVKLSHTIGPGAVSRLFKRMKKELETHTKGAIDPATASWEALKEHIQSSHYSDRNFLLERFGAVDFVILVGRAQEKALVVKASETPAHELTKIVDSLLLPLLVRQAAFGGLM